MGAAKAKRKKPVSSNRSLREPAAIPVYEDEVLRAFRLPTEPRDQVLFLHAMLNKYLCVAGGRLLGRKAADGGFETVLGFVDLDSISRTLANIENNLNIDLHKWAVPPGSESTAKLEAIGWFFTPEETELMAAIVSSDPEAIQSHREGIADRMDADGRNDDGRFIFPDLSEEEYEQVRANQNRKPN
jgi:hypothetical protein